MGSARGLSVLLATIWSLCVLNCLTEKATAHWHVQASGKAHHHHHPLNSSHDKHQHERGEPVDNHSPDSGAPECAELKARPASFQLCAGPSFASASVRPSPLLAMLFQLPLVAGLSGRGPEGLSPSNHADLTGQVLALRVPNAPPANVII